MGDEIGRTLRDWWSGVGRPRRIMLGATGLLFVSQFLPSGDQTQYFLTRATDLTRYTGMASTSVTVDGWTLHPQAYVVLVCLLVAFASSLAEEPALRRWIYWAGAAAVFVAIVPSAPVRTIGGFLGFVAFGLAIWAARTARKMPVS